MDTLVTLHTNYSLLHINTLEQVNNQLEEINRSITDNSDIRTEGLEITQTGNYIHIKDKVAVSKAVDDVPSLGMKN